MGITTGKNRERFVRLAESRVNNALNTIRLIGNLSNRGNYVYSDKDVQRIFSALDNELKAARGRFGKGDGCGASLFKLEPKA